jgi:hypothetical protein
MSCTSLIQFKLEIRSRVPSLFTSEVDVGVDVVRRQHRCINDAHHAQLEQANLEASEEVGLVGHKPAETDVTLSCT